MFRVFCVGEVLFDKIGDDYYFGGAPLNVAAHLARFGVRSYIVSAVGADTLGATALSKMYRYKIDRSFVKTDPAHKTGIAVVHPERDGNERFELPENAAYDFVSLSETELERISALRPDAVVFGSLAQKRSDAAKRAIRSLLGALPDAERFFDVNLRKAYFDREIIASSIDLSTVFKLNDTEIEIVSPLLFGQTLQREAFAERIFKEFPCRLVVVTLGKEGAAAYRRDVGSAFSPAVDAPVVDTVGAGDAFSAGFLASWLSTRDLSAALGEGNAAGARTVAHKGALPE